MKTIVVLALLAPAALSQGHVLVVDAGGGGAYTQITTALQNASPGDVLLVKSGSYRRFAVANQSVAVVGDVSATVQIAGTVQVRNLAAGGTALLHGLQVFGALSTAANDGPGFSIRNDAGAVRVQECIAQGAAGKPGVRVEEAEDVALAGVHSFGGSAWPNSGEGLVANGHAIAIYECDLHGGPAAVPLWSNYPACIGGNGGCAVRSAMNGFLWVGATLLIGGVGTNGADGCSGNTTYTLWCSGGNGGHCLDLMTGAHSLWTLGSTSLPGQFGYGGYGTCGCGFSCCCSGDSGTPGLALAANYDDYPVNLPGDSPTLALGLNPMRENSSVGISVDSAPGATATLIVSGYTPFQLDLPRGVRMVDMVGAHLSFGLGTTDAQGHLQASWPIGDLGPGIESQILYLQVLVTLPTGPRRWSNPVALVLLDSAF
ncbi:MAG: hypothetical protein IPJ19_21435 [Planctomycetes bacterium]|nr:hypothetical protein [Planctomycetota bacterium]